MNEYTESISPKVQRIDPAGSGVMDVNVVGGTLSVVEPITVDAINLDLRDLAFASDKVDISGSSGVGVTGTFFQATQPVSVATVPSHDVTNAGTFAVQVTSAPSTVVTATDLDVRNLTATDVVTVTGGAGQTADVKVTLDGESVPVTGTFYQATQPISATDLDIRNLAKAQDEVYSVLRTDAGVAYDARSVTVQNATIAVTQSGTWDEVGINDSGNSITVDAPVGTPVFVRLSDGASAITTLPVSLATNTPTLQANSGVDVGDVTINNATGASAVNIQDGGNTITVDGTVSVTGSTIQDIPATSGGLSKFHLVGAATTNQTNIKNGAGQVYGITAFNVAATPAYLKFHNTAGTPTAGAGVTDTFLIPGNTAGAGVVINIDKGIVFGTGIGITITAGIADADTTAIAASNVVVNVYYK